MKSAKENLGQFSEPMKQELENKGCLKGCLWPVIKWILILSVISAILSECNNTPAESDQETSVPPSTTQAAVLETPNSDPTGNNQETSAPPPTTQATEAVVPGNNQLPFIEKQLEYAEKHDIQLHRFPDEEAKLAYWLENSNPNAVYLTADNIFGADKYKRTERYDGYLYYGELKDNRPDGYGILFAASEIGGTLLVYENHAYVCRYIGQFSNGRFQGFGVLFTESANGHAFQSRLRPYNEATGENIADFLTWANYAEYFGEFSDGYISGLGNRFSLSDGYIGSFEIALNEIDLDNPGYSVVVGQYEKGERNGAIKYYIAGFLLYDGEAKDDMYNGYGTLYHYGSTIPSYKGEFKNDLRHGTGTSYSETGEIIYEGQWRYDEYA